MPRSFTVVSIPVPPAFPADQSVGYVVTAMQPGMVLGRLAGTIAPAAGGERLVLLTLGVPSRARAGTLPVATVRFSAGGVIVDVPVGVMVAARREIDVVTVEGPTVVAAGANYRLTYRLTNIGNAADTVAVRIDTPPGWREIGSRVAIRLDVNGTAEQTAVLSVPASASGSVSLRVGALSHAEPANAEVVVNVLAREDERRVAGPDVTLASGWAYGPWGSVASVHTARIDGALTDRIGVAARASRRATGEVASGYAFSRAGIFAAPPSLQLTARDWRFGLGLSGVNCSELCGVNVSGNGASMTVDRRRWEASAFAARPDPGLLAARGALGVVRVEAKLDRFSISTAVAHLSEERDESRRLDAISLGSGFTDGFGGRWTGELARRRYAGGDGTGWSSSYSHQGPDNRFDLRYTSAPGGSRAYARATRDVSVSGSRSIGRRLSVNGSAWNSVDDGSASFQKLAMQGWSAGAATTIAGNTNLSLSGHGSEFVARATAGAGDFGNEERGLEGAVGVRHGFMMLSGTATGSRLTRSTNLASGEVVSLGAPRGGLRGAIGTSGSSGSVELTGHVEHTGRGIGLPPSQWSYGARFDRIALGSYAGARFLARADVERFRGFGSTHNPLAISGTLTATVPRIATLELSAERNPFIFASMVGGKTIYVVSVSRSTSIARLARDETRGFVFKDLNGNGVRDAGEEGFPRITIRRGSDIAVTDAAGSFAFIGETEFPLEIDARSLPVGWIAPSTTLAREQRRIGILAVSAVVIRLQVVDGDTSRVSLSDLEKVAIVARDAGGRVWVARRGSPTSAFFDALPPGTYTLDVDASGSSEPLFVEVAPPPLVVSGSHALAPLTIALRARSLRFTPPRSR